MSPPYTVDRPEMDDAKYIEFPIACAYSHEVKLILVSGMVGRTWGTLGNLRSRTPAGVHRIGPQTVDRPPGDGGLQGVAFFFRRGTSRRAFACNFFRFFCSGLLLAIPWSKPDKNCRFLGRSVGAKKPFSGFCKVHLRRCVSQASFCILN